MTTVDLDARIAEAVAKAKKEQKWNKAKVFDREWRVTTEPNTYAALQGSFGDVEALIGMFDTIIHPDEREDFRKALLSAENMSADVLMQLLNGLVEVAAERPTKSRSGSSRSQVKTQAASRKSSES